LNRQALEVLQATVVTVGISIEFNTITTANRVTGAGDYFFMLQ
jgi:hypothetical protein